MDDVEVIVSIVGGLVVIAAALIGLWIRLHSDPGSRKVTIGRDSDGPVTTGNQSPAASGGGIAAGRDVNIIQRGPDEEKADDHRTPSVTEVLAERLRMRDKLEARKGEIQAEIDAIDKDLHRTQVVLKSDIARGEGQQYE